MWISTLFLSAILVAFAKGGDVAWTPCPAGTPGAPEKNHLEFQHTLITGCTEQPCKFMKGKSTDVEMEILFHSATKKIMCALSTLSRLGPLPLISHDLCPNVISEGKCANIQPGSLVKAKVTHEILEVFPTYSGEVRLIVSDDKGSPLFCGQLRISIEGPGGSGAVPLSLPG